MKNRISLWAFLFLVILLISNAISAQNCGKKLQGLVRRYVAFAFKPEVTSAQIEDVAHDEFKKFVGPLLRAKVKRTWLDRLLRRKGKEVTDGVYVSDWRVENENSKSDSNPLTPLHLAAGRGDLEKINELLATGADPRAMDSLMGVSVLHKAVYSGNPAAVDAILKAGALINVQSPSNGDTALHDALYFKGPQGADVIRVLLRYRPTLSIHNRAGLTPIESARLLKDSESEKLISDYDSTLHSVEGVALMNAVKKNNIDSVQKILEAKKVNLSEVNDEGFSPLIWASREGFYEIVQLLLDKGADPNQNDEWMRANSGHKAAFWGRDQVIRLLIERHLNVNAQGGYNGYTALHDAIVRGHVEVVQALVNARALTNIPGHDGKTAEILAAQSTNTEIKKLVLKE
ncbi:MAG: ankyrin repeat family protein [Bacteriovoracaceae bacterium]|nr:ankyrin repeat family protein [Bacteriovoracaceae bacterium]